MKRTSGREAHLYALMAWSDKYERVDAESIVDKSEYKDLDQLTYAETSIETAIEEINKTFFAGEKVVSADDIAGKKIEDSQDVYDNIILIINQIHRKWVSENPHKYHRGTEEKSDKNLFQHLPTALIGIDEVAKDLMFLAPFMKELGIDCGEMDLVKYGAFKPSQEVVDAYARYVEKFKEKYLIQTDEDLKDYIRDCINGAYQPLTVEGVTKKKEFAEQRVGYMKGKQDVLLQSVKAKNPSQFEKISGNPEQGLQ